MNYALIKFGESARDLPVIRERKIGTHEHDLKALIIGKL